MRRSSFKNLNIKLIFLPPNHLPRKTLFCKNQENPSDRISHAWAPLKVLANQMTGQKTLNIGSKREIFDRSNFPDFYAIKSSWVGDLVVKILTYYFNF